MDWLVDGLVIYFWNIRLFGGLVGGVVSGVAGRVIGWLVGKLVWLMLAVSSRSSNDCAGVVFFFLSFLVKLTGRHFFLPLIDGVCCWLLLQRL